MSRGTRRVAAAAVMIGFLAAAAPAQAAYFAGPAPPPAVTCATTATSLSALETNVSSAAGGSTHCLANGTYAATLTLRTTATSPVTVASVSGYGAVVTGGVIINSRDLTVQGLDVQNTTTSGSGDCVTIAAGLTTSAVSVQYSRIHNCNRNGVRMSRPACAPTPCTPTEGYTSGVTLNHDWFSDVGNADISGTHVILRGDSSTLRNFDITDGPNDAILAWGDSLTISNGRVHDLAASGTNHNDVVQSWYLATPDAAQGMPLTNFTFERVRMWSINGPHAHGIISQGTGQSKWRISSNEFRTIGAQAISLGSSAAAGDVTGVSIVGNTFVSAGAANTIEFVNGSSGTVKNNIFRNCVGWGSEPVWVGTGSVTKDYNLSFGGEQVAGEAHSLTNTDPKLVGESSGDLHLKSRSSAIGAGDDTAVSPGWLDIDGTARRRGSHTDIGADEQ